MTEAQQLREQMASARNAADATNLPNVRARYIEAALVWERLADQADRFEELKSSPQDPDW
jgi:hypothetical protein